MRLLSTPLLHGLCRIPDVLVHTVVSEGKGCHGAGEERLQMLAHLHCKVVCLVICAKDAHDRCDVGERTGARQIDQRACV